MLWTDYSHIFGGCNKGVSAINIHLQWFNISVEKINVKRPTDCTKHISLSNLNDFKISIFRNFVFIYYSPKHA